MVISNQTICVPGKEFPGILQNKKLQVEDEWRGKFKIKLATCLARLTNEERASGLIDVGSGNSEPPIPEILSRFVFSGKVSSGLR